MHRAFGLISCLLFAAACGGNARSEQPTANDVVATDAAATDAVAVDDECAAAPAVIGCGCAQEPTPPPEVWSCVECANIPQTSALIGAEGGSFTLRGSGTTWFTLTIPPHALSAPTKLQISESVRPPVSLIPASSGYLIEPRGIEFAVPVSVKVPTAKNKLGTGLYWSPDTCSEPTWLPSSVPENGAVSGTLSRTGVVFAASSPAPDPTQH